MQVGVGCSAVGCGQNMDCRSIRILHVSFRSVNWCEENTDYWKSSIDASSYWRLHLAAYKQDQLEIISTYCEYDGFHTNLVVFALRNLS